MARQGVASNENNGRILAGMADVSRMNFKIHCKVIYLTSFESFSALNFSRIQKIGIDLYIEHLYIEQLLMTPKLIKNCHAELFIRGKVFLPL